MIPDKIYISVGTLSSNQPSEEYPFPGWQEKPYSQVRSAEYIRKDALLEWLMECKENPVITDLQRENIQEMIEKIESL